MSYLVTGSDGFIGSHLMDKLNDARPFDIASTGDDIRSAEDLDAALDETIGGIFHLAAEADVWNTDRYDVFDTNVRGTAQVLSKANEYGIDNVIIVSSIAAKTPTTPYAGSKSTMETLCRDMFGQTTIIRPSNVIGPGAVRGQVHAMIDEAIKDGTIEVWGNGGITRSYIDVRDVVDTMTGNTIAGEYGTTTAKNEEIARHIKDIVEDRFSKEVTLEMKSQRPPSPDRLTVDDEMDGEYSLRASLADQIDNHLLTEQIHE